MIYHIISLYIKCHSPFVNCNSNTQNMENRRTYKKISDEIRELIIKRMDSGFTAKEVGEQFQILPNTVRKIYKTYQRTNVLKKRNAGHRKQKLTVLQKEIICDYVDLDCTVTLKQLKEKCNTQWPDLEISLSTINRALKEFHYSVKRITYIPERRNSPEIIQVCLHNTYTYICNEICTYVKF